jgi:protein phosphatase
MKLQVQALFQDLSHNPAGIIIDPPVIAEQLAASVRVVNNLITAENDLQHRNNRQRMATTLVMVIHVQQVLDGNPDHRSHEWYVVQLGDSRAYWMTQKNCHPLTVDDDVAGREVRMGRSFYREALQRQDASSLTQALGSRTGDALHVHIQRFIVDEDGIFLLCSDGLSDNGWVERYWNGSTAALLSEMQTLEEIAQEWIDLGNQRNGQDNLSVGLMRCQVSSSYGVLLDPFPDGGVTVPPDLLAEPAVPALDLPTEYEESLEIGELVLHEEPLTAASAALLAETAATQSSPMSARASRKGWLPIVALGGLLLVLILGAGFTFVWLNSSTVRSLVQERLFPSSPAKPQPPGNPSN